MLRKGLMVAAFLGLFSTTGFAAILDGKSFEVTFESDPEAQQAPVEFKKGMIVSPIHQTIVDKEKEYYKEEGVTGMKLALMKAPAGTPFTDEQADDAVNFTGRIEGFPAVYWSGSVRDGQIEGTVTVESYMGGYLIPFKGTEK